MDISFTDVMRYCFRKNKNTAISFFLVTSYAYYVRDYSLTKDTTYDKLCQYLLKEYDSLDHVHKSLVTKDMLRAGTAYNLSKECYPSRVRETAEDWINWAEGNPYPEWITYLVNECGG